MTRGSLAQSWTALSAADMPAAGFLHPRFRRPLQLYSKDARGNDEQVTKTVLEHMARLAYDSADSPQIAAGVREATAHLPPNATDRQRFDSVWHWTKQRVTYVGEEELIEPFDFFFPPDELLIAPAELLKSAKAEDDCDGFSMLIMSMLRAMGYRSAFKTIAANPDAPDLYSHVFVVAYDSKGQPYPLDGSHGPKPGVEYRRVTKARIWPIEEPARMIHNTRPGMGTIDWGTLLSSGTKIAEGVLIPRFGNPPPGTTRTTDPKSGATNISTYPGGGISGDLSGGTLALIAVVLIGGVVLVSSRGK